MDISSFKLIKSIGICDVIIGVLIPVILLPFLGAKSCIFALGILCSFINFVINAYTTNFLIDKKGKMKLLTVAASYGIRIFLVCGIGIGFARYSIIKFVIFVAGYSAQLLAILLYGFSLTKE